MNGKKIKRIIIAGKGASGKDYLRKSMESKGFKYCISHTTRPRRNDEIEGVDYYFINDNRASEMCDNSEFYEHVVFNGWLYGTSKEEFNKSNLFIMTPKGISGLKKDDRENSFIVYIDIEDTVRTKRLSERNDVDIVERRVKADFLDFCDFEDYDFKIKDPEFRPDYEWCNLKIIDND